MVSSVAKLLYGNRNSMVEETINLRVQMKFLLDFSLKLSKINIALFLGEPVLPLYKDFPGVGVPKKSFQWPNRVIYWHWDKSKICLWLCLGH